MLPTVKFLWFEYRRDVKGWMLVAAIVLALASVLFTFDRLANPEVKFLKAMEGEASALIRTSRSGDYAMGASLWEIEVQLPDGSSVAASSTMMVSKGTKVCLAVFEKGRWGEDYRIIGMTSSMDAAGKACTDWTP